LIIGEPWRKRKGFVLDWFVERGREMEGGREGGREGEHRRIVLDW